MIRQISPVVAGGAAERLTATSDATGDAIKACGVELPDHLNTKTRRWLSLLLVAVSGAFASGPLLSFPTLEPILIQEGVWAGPDQVEKLSSVYSIATGTSMIAVLAGGVVFDALGPRVVGAVGAFGVVGCLITMALAVSFPWLNDLLWVAYPAASAFGYMNSMDSYAWLWLLPEDQNTVAAVAGAIQCLSDSFVLVAVFLHDVFGWHISSYFILSAVLAWFAGWVALEWVPCRQDHLRYAAEVIRYQAGQAGDSYGALDASNSRLSPSQQENVEQQKLEDTSLSGALSKSLGLLRDSVKLMIYVHPGSWWLFFFYQMALYMFTVYPSFEMYPLYSGLLGSAKATLLVDIYGGLYACVGAGCLLLFGRFVDWVGMKQAVFWIMIPIVVNTVLYSIPSVPAQVLAQVFLSSLGNIWYVQVSRFCLAYTPPELFGSLWGACSAMLGVGQIFLTRFGTWVSTLAVEVIMKGHAGEAFPILVTIYLWSFLSLLGSVMMLIWWYINPLPKNGSTTMDDVKSAGAESQSVEPQGPSTWKKGYTVNV